MRFVILFLLFCKTSYAQTTLYFVRHAEKQNIVGLKDPELTPIGQFRANNIANQLSKAGIKHIFSTNYKRTLQTAQPLAEFLGLEIEIYNPSKPVAFSEKLKKLNSTALIVGHSNTTTQLASLVSGKALYPIAENEYDNMYQVILDGDKKMLNWLKTIPSYVVKTKIKPQKVQLKQQ